MTGTPVFAAIARAEILLPRERIAFALGPIHTSPALRTAAAKSAFSERKPYPEWIASAPDFFAAARIASIER